MNNEKWATFLVTADICLIEQAVEVAGIIITASEANACAVAIYDGVNTNGKLFGYFRVPANNSKNFKFAQPVTCNYGLYIDIDANTNSVMVIYKPVSETEV